VAKLGWPAARIPLHRAVRQGPADPSTELGPVSNSADAAASVFPPRIARARGGEDALTVRDPGLIAPGPYVLIVPTYGGGTQGRGTVPPQVVRFLNHNANRALIRGVITAGNTNFGAAYGLAGDIVAAKCQVPCLAKFELMGTPADAERIRAGLTEWWGDQ
jgi:protein involved in ribonucleotide reduction